MSISGVSSGNSMISSLLMKALDQDKSGAASLEEFTSVGQSLDSGSVDKSDDALAKAFSSLDADQDGSLTESEISQGLAKFSSESAGALLGAQEAGGPPPPPPGGPGGPGGGGGGFFAEADSDDSGTVSLEEFTAAGPQSASSDEVESLFSQIDADGDGEISSTEDEAFREAQGPGGPGGAGGPPPGGASASSNDTDDEEDDVTQQFLASISDRLSAQGAYSQSATSFLDEAISSLFSSAA